MHIDQLNQLLAILLVNNGSDLHLVPGQYPYFRIDGFLTPVKQLEPITPPTLNEILRQIIPEAKQEIFNKKGHVDFSYILPQNSGRFRVNVFKELCGTAAAFRTIPAEIPSAKNLCIPKYILNFTSYMNGLFVIVGPTGTGKSTTLACLIDKINRTRAARIITAEDPIEFVHTNKKSLISHREIGIHASSFAETLKSALREDPDVLLVGEMRDLETISLGIEAALTGHLVFTTIHAKNVSQTIDRIVKSFPPGEQERIRIALADALIGICAQTLIKKSFEKGRVPIFELLTVTPGARNLIRKGEHYQFSNLSGRAYIKFQDSISERVKEKLISEDYANEIEKHFDDNLNISTY